MVRFSSVVVLGGVLTAACTSEIDGSADATGGLPVDVVSGGESSTLPDSNADPASALPVMRRLTPREYNNTVADLLGDSSRPADSFDPDGTVNGFDNQIEQLSVDLSRARQWLTSAQLLSAEADLTALVPCDAALTGEEQCATQFAREFGKRAFRRPLIDAEVMILMGVYATGRQDADFESGIRQMIQAMLVMPQFLYRMDVTPSEVPVAKTPGWVPLDNYQVASRLSYVLLQSMPDAELFRAADAGELLTAQGVAAQVDRLLSLAAAKATAKTFYDQWFGLARLGRIAKSADTFPEFDDSTREALGLEIDRFLEHALWTEGGSLPAFFSSNATFRDATLDEYYAGTDERGAGLLSLGGVLAMLSTPDHSDPVRRGMFVRQQVLCQSVPPPPPGLSVMFPEIDENSTTREKFAQHQNDAVCAACHRLMDGIGLGFENYDAIGRYRTEEHGIPVDASGELVDTDVDGPFVGLTELGSKLSQSQIVADCVAQRWFQFIAGRAAKDSDQATLEQLRPALTSTGQVAMLKALAQTDTFRMRFEGDEL